MECELNAFKVLNEYQFFKFIISAQQSVDI